MSATRSAVVLGVGRWGNEWIATIDAHRSVTLAATAGGRRSETTRRMAPALHLSDFREVLTDVEADIALVTLPVQLHAEAVELALESGKHVLCEKPAADSPENLARIVAAARAHPHLVVKIDQNYRHRTWARVMRWALESGCIGELGSLEVRFSQPEFLGGGRKGLDNPLLQDMAIHHFDLIRYLCGSDVKSLAAFEYRPAWTTFTGSPGLDVTATLDNGVRAVYHGSWAARGGQTSWDGDYIACGSAGVLRFTGGSFEVEGTSESEVLVQARAELGAVPHPSTEVGPDLTVVLDALLEDISTGRAPECGIEDNRRTVDVQFAAEQSLRSGSSVCLG